MIVSVDGVLSAAGPGYAVVVVGGVGLRVHVPASTIAKLPAAGERLKLLTSLQVREDSLTLYGFLTEAEQQLFSLLLGVSGLGPAKALALLSASSVDALRADIAGEHAAALMRIPGVGRKLAAQIILDLKGKIGGVTARATDGMVGPGVAETGDSEIVDWLVSLGFGQREALAAMGQVPPAPGLSQDERALQALTILRRG